MQLCLWTRIEQLSRWMVGDNSQVSHCWDENLQISKVKSFECYMCDGLEFETSIRTHVWYNIDVDDYI